MYQTMSFNYIFGILPTPSMPVLMGDMKSNAWSSLGTCLQDEKASPFYFTFPSTIWLTLFLG